MGERRAKPLGPLYAASAAITRVRDGSRMAETPPYRRLGAQPESPALKRDAPPANFQKSRSLCGDKNPDLSARSLDCFVDDLPQAGQELAGFVAHHRVGYWSGTVVNPVNIVGPMSC